jgi:2-hydroxychromene-2-carboxylate isomerase
MAREAAIETLRGMEVPATVNDEWIKKLKQQIDVLKDTDLTGVTQDQCEVLLNEKGGKLVRMLQKTEELFNRAQQAAEPVERQLQAQQQSISSLEEKIKVFSAAGRSTAQLEQQLADQKKALEDAKTNAAPILQKRDDLKAINEGGAKVQASLQARQEDIKNPGGLRPTTPGSTT